ncbi:MAG: Glu-tRNA(Gln) amidotransferase subunit GatE [Candidatus Woesearchaeota archaeon]|jgi:glutamyl-tRNA(Gln) amidotransferase subunit E
MTPEEWSKLGLKCGIEIHQQLEGKKLFCNCPTILREDEPHFTIKRKLRAVAGEGGKIDVAAAQEQAKDLTFVYQGYNDTTCLVEADCEPPHVMNQESLYTTLQFCKLVNAKVNSIVQVMRKTVVDGSNTSGFQRTSLIARGGIIPTEAGEVRIENISLEEDACKNVSESANERVWRMDRLGIPLIEIGTAPDIKTPEQCHETAKRIGTLLRSLPGVKRGLGTIRQDLNISIQYGNRIEIKGAQDLKMIPTWVETEAKRQEKLLELHRQVRKNKEFKVGEVNELNDLFSNTESPLIKKTVEKKGKIYGAKLPGFQGVLGMEIAPNRRFGTEMSDYAKIFGVGGMIHSDEDLNKYKFSAEEIKAIKKKLQINEGDGFIIIADQEEKAKKAIQAALTRAETQLKLAVPKEVRKANPDGTTSYMRPMPGAARMYPETDVPLVRPDLSKVEVPETLEEKFVRYQKEYGLAKDLAEHTARSEMMPLFEEITAKYPSLKAAFIAETLTSIPGEIKKKYNLDSDKLAEENFRELFQYLSEDKIHKDIVIDVLIDMIKGTFDLKNYTSLATEEIHKIIKEIVDTNKGAPLGALMGQCMKKLAGKASGKVISDTLNKILREGHK